MRILVLALSLGISLILQATFFDYFRLLGVKPDLVIVLVTFYGFLHGKREGAYFGFLSGLMADFMTGNYIGLNALAKMTAGFVAGIGEKRLYQENVFVATMMCVVGSVSGEFVYYILLLLLQMEISPLNALTQVILPVGIYNGIFSLLLYNLFYRSSTRGLLKTPEL